jgi:hypothetical protein
MSIMATNTEKLDNIAINVAQLSTDFTSVKKQTSEMYKILVTGNGVKPLPEVVRNHEDWICAHKEADKAKKDFTWKVALEIAKQVIYPVGIALAVWLGLR